MQPLFSRAFPTCLAGLGALFLSSASLAAITPLSASQCETMQKDKVFTAENPVKCERLAQVSFDYVDFEGQRHDDGQLVVLDVVAPQVQALFNKLRARGFPLRQARTLEKYEGDDEASMRDNNSSAFNGRPMTGNSRVWSKHAYGVAIDINPLQNPYIGRDADKQTVVLPPAARDQYAARTPLRAGMAESARDIFFRHGFLVWGGYWKQPIDYQHFEIGSREFIGRLLALPLAAARAEFKSYAASYASCVAVSTKAIPDPAARQKACAGKSKR